MRGPCLLRIAQKFLDLPLAQRMANIVIKHEFDRKLSLFPSFGLKIQIAVKLYKAK